MPFNVADGTYSEATALQPLDATYLPAVQQPTMTAGQQSPGEQGTVADTTGMFQSQAAAGEADCRAAQASAMDARDAMLAHFQSQALPVGGHIGDDMPLPLVPDNATPAAQSDLYPYAGMEPTPAAAGFYVGDEPTLPT